MSAETMAGDQQKRRIPLRRAAIVAAGLLLLLGVGALLIPRAADGNLPAIFGWQRRQYQAPGWPSTLSDIHDIDELAALFNQNQRTPRLILLFSPT